tara:strand:+ start:3596 stop:4069 length:474 start_codon:yes stop_codon:yes gene_type:complete
MIKKNIFCILIMLLVTGCVGYEPLYSGNESNFNIGKIDYKGTDIKIAKKIGKSLKNIIRSKNNLKKIDIIINLKKDKKIATKDDRGTTTNFEMLIIINIIATETSNNETLLEKEYSFQKIYQNKSTASETANLESKMIDDTVSEAVRLINMDIQTLQ